MSSGQRRPLRPCKGTVEGDLCMFFLSTLPCPFLTLFLLDTQEHRDRPHERRLTEGRLKTQPLSKVIERCVQENQTSFFFGKREAGGAITLPSEISQLTCVKQLEIKGTKIKLLGKDICKLTQLTNLRIVGNPSLGVLPKTIGNLTQLKELLLKQNSISSLPSGIGSLTALQRLDLSGNSLASVCPELGLLSQLEWLSLRGSRFTDIPSQLGALTSLTYLALDKNSALSRLPVSLCQLTKLTTLLLDKENDWVIPPPDVVLAGQKSPPKILTYLGELRAQMVPCTRVKLFIVGSESGGGQG
jgi:hypothetical protein